MTARLTVGLSQKIGQPNFGSVGASCHIDFELESNLLNGEREQLTERIRETFLLCRQEVRRELAADIARESEHVPESNPVNGSGGSANGHSQNGGRRTPARPATDAQIRAIHAIAAKAKVQVASQLESEFGVRSPRELNLWQASELIELLKSRLESS